MATQFSGGTYVNATFTGAVKSDLQINIKTNLIAAGWTCVAASAGWGPGNVGTITITIASPGVVTFPAHGFLGGEQIILNSTGALPTGLTAGTVYYVKYLDANTFNLSASSGGSNINTSGSQSGVHTLNSQAILMQSATQANVTNPIRVRLVDNTRTCIQVHVENQAGTVKSPNQASSNYGLSLWPGTAKTWRIIATQYHFLCFTPGVSVGREFVMAGMLYVPSFLTSVTDHGYVFGNGGSDSVPDVYPSIRTQSSLLYYDGNTGLFQVLWNSSFLEGVNLNGVGAPDLVFTAPAAAAGSSQLKGFRWANDDINTSDVLLSSGLTSTTDEGKLKGQLFDMLYIGDAFTVDSTDTFNGHTWWNITSNNLGRAAGNNPRGGIWVATS